MTNESLHSLIEQLNIQQVKGHIFCRPLTYQVDLAQVWLEKPSPSDTIVWPDDPYDIYFIRKPQVGYVGAVLDMGTYDLHAYMLPEHRKQGHLTQAMRAVILPHLFQERTVQHLTIDKSEVGQPSYNAAAKVAAVLGFKWLKEDQMGVATFRLGRPRAMRDVMIVGQDSQMTEQRLDELRQQVYYHSRSLKTILAEVEAHYGQDNAYAKKLKKLTTEVRDHTRLIENEWLFQNKIQNKKPNTP